MLLIWREGVKETITIDNTCPELRMTHLLAQLLPSRLVFAEEMHIPSHTPLQWGKSIGMR